MADLRRIRPAFLISVLLALLTIPEGTGSAKNPGPQLAASAVPPGETPSYETHPEIQELQRDLEGILTSTGNRRGRWAVLAVSLDRHDTLLAMNPRERMVPASNMKVLSTAAALHYLGPDFRYRTFLMADGRVEGGVLDGDLVLYGTGDPSLSERFFPSETAPLDSLAEAVLAEGVREVRGNLVVDGSFFHGPDRHPRWDPEDLNDAFAAPVSAVSLAENLVTVRVEAGSWLGAQPSIHTIPSQAGIPLSNIARTVASGTRSRIWLFRDTPEDPIGIEGEIPLGGADVWRRLPVPDPLAFSGTQLRQALEARGIRIAGDVVTTREASLSPLSNASLATGSNGREPPRILAVQDSPPLLDFLRIINKESNNFFAESVLKTLGRVVTGEGSFAGGGRAVESFLLDIVGVHASEVSVMDGSGLAMDNQASPAVFVRTLEYMASTPHWDQFLATLPEAGVRRELGRMYRSPAAGNLRAKTGTMDGVSALSGLVETRAGERILFSIISNEVISEYRAKRAEDQVGIRLASITRTWPD